jgi:hypothetical protein
MIFRSLRNEGKLDGVITHKTKMKKKRKKSLRVSTLKTGTAIEKKVKRE